MPSSGPADLPDLLTLVGAAVWPLFAGVTSGEALRPDAGTVDRAFAPLTPRLRILAGLVLDASAAVTHGVKLESVLGRMATLGEGSAGVLRALARHDADARWVDGLYTTLEGTVADARPSLDGASTVPPNAHEERRFLLASAIALADRLPLGLDGGEALVKHGETGLAIAVGDAARVGDPGARAIVRDFVAQATTSDVLVFALLFGLGAGSFGEGLARLTTLASGAILEPARWAAAALRACALMGDVARAEGTTVVGAIERALALSPDVAAALAVIQRLPPRLQAIVIDGARRELTARPAAVRAAVARARLTKTLFDAPLAAMGGGDGGAGAEAERGSLGWRDDPRADLLRERSPSVVLLLLELIGSLGDAIPAEVVSALGRAWSDHPDVAVRRALAATIAPRAGDGQAKDGASAEVVALPTAALARDDLDRLRAALWSGESERIVELATCVPLDRRAPARESLLAALEIPNAPLRRAIVEAIGRIGGQSDGPRLLDAARRYRALEGTVAAALRELGAKAMAESLAEIYRRRLKWADDDAVDDYCAIAGPEQVMHLLEALETRYYPSARAGAARAIARRRASEVVFALRTAALSDTQDTARLAALGALHELTGTGPSGDEMAGHALLFRATEELPDTIERAREAGAAALTGIRRTIARGSWKRRRAACDVLATLPSGEATQVLVEVLEDPDEDVRLAAVEALAQRGWEPSSARERTLQALAARRVRELADAGASGVDAGTLVLALGFGGHVFRAEVLDALAAVAGAQGFTPTAEELGVIAAARMDVVTAVRAPRGLEAVLRAIDHTWQANPHRARFVRELAALPTATLVAQLEVEGTSQRAAWTWRAREAIAQALERGDDEVALQVLGRLVGEDDDDVRRAALQTLAWIGTPAAAGEVARGFQSPFQEDRDLVARALGTFGPRALEVIAELVQDGWWESRQGAALALGHWREATQVAVDRLIQLAVDPEYRVAQAARESLATHGLLPTTTAVCEMLGKAQALTLEGLEPWLGLQRAPTAPPDIADRLDALIEELPPDAMPQRLGLIATFRAEHLALWLEEVALGQGDSPHAKHVGVRLAASDALRTLSRAACAVCAGEGSVRCPGCNGAGDVPCATCQGRGTVLVPCPDPGCTAIGTLRRIDSPRCATCRGRGEVPAPCACENNRGRVACVLCQSRGRLGCSACDGTGRARDTMA